MYEDKKRKLKINWKSLLIKMAILLVIVFLIIWIISLFKKDKEVPSNIGDNLKTMQEVANDYFIGSRLPDRINGKETLTLKEMLDNKLLLEFKDQDGKSCDENNSYAEVTKVSDNSYTIKVKLVCTKDNDYIIDTFSVDTPINNDVTDDENKQDENNSEEENTGTNTGTSTDNSTSTKPSTTPSQNQTSSTGSSKPSTGSQNTTSSKPNTGSQNTTSSKPSTSTGSQSTSADSQSTSSSKPSSSTESDTKPSTTPSQSSGSSNQSKPDTETEPTKPSTEPDNDTCMYGSKEYLSIYPLAYEISEKCAVNKDEYLNYVREVNSIGNAEFNKIKAEISDLAANTNTSLYVDEPIYEGVYNISNTGLVGYQIKFIVKQRLNSSTNISKIIYVYYIDGNGNRKAVVDNRASLQITNNNLSSKS